MQNIDRRRFLEFLGIGSAALMVPGCAMSKGSAASPFPFRKIAPSNLDELKLARGLSYEVLISWGDVIGEGQEFGFNNDYIAFIPSVNNPDEGILWVNHEYTAPSFVADFWEYENVTKTKEQVEKEMLSVGGSILRVKREKGKWHVIKDDPINRRITGMTEIPFNWSEPIMGSRTAMGTLGNCSGGVTPWGTILTCEENYDMFYGERHAKTSERVTDPADLGWYHYYDNPPEHYGWVVEVNLQTGEAQKHVALGRCAHESATIKELEDGRVVVYSGDDSINQCLYKFISSKPGSLSEGTLYVANIETGKWISLNYDDQITLRKLFKDQTEVLVRLRKAARYVGGTPLDRPEDIEINPRNGDVLVSLTNNVTKGNFFGSIMKIEEKDGRHDALEFKASTLHAGGKETGFACPDNMAFDPAGNLWFTSDISGAAMNNPSIPEYLPFKNNSLFVVPVSGKKAGEVIRVANAPTEAEMTGPFFSPDGKTLFLSVQHPGEYSPAPDALTSHWPEGENRVPRPSVVAIYGMG